MDDVNPRRISHGPNALWEATAEVDRLRTALTTAQGQVADYKATLKRVTEEHQAERDALKAATQAALEIYRVHWQTVHTHPRPSCETCRIGLMLSHDLPAKPDSREGILASLDHPTGTTGETETR